MGTATSDEQIVERALTGDAEAFGEIVQRWERRIFALAFGMLGREEDARDATQETFLAAFRNLRAFRSQSVLVVASDSRQPVHHAPTKGEGKKRERTRDGRAKECREFCGAGSLLAGTSGRRLGNYCGGEAGS